MVELGLLRAVAGVLRVRLGALRADDRGSVSLEQVIITGALAAVGVAVAAILMAKVLSKAHSISTGP